MAVARDSAAAVSSGEIADDSKDPRHRDEYHNRHGQEDSDGVRHRKQDQGSSDRDEDPESPPPLVDRLREAQGTGILVGSCHAPHPGMHVQLATGDHAPRHTSAHRHDFADRGGSVRVSGLFASDTACVQEVNRDELRPKDWWLFHALHSGSRDQRVELERGVTPRARAAWRAWEMVDSIIEAGGGEALELVLALLHAAPDHKSAAATVGAGPLEELVHEHGAELFDAMSDLARRDPTFSVALSCVWLEHGALPTAVERGLTRWVRVTNPG